MTATSTLQAEIDALQVRTLGPSPTPDEVVDFFNRMVNSAMGAMAHHVGEPQAWMALSLFQAYAGSKGRKPS